MTKYPNIHVVITEKDAEPLKLILKISSILAQHQIPSWVRMEFMEKALACKEFNVLKNFCKSYVKLENGQKDLIF